MPTWKPINLALHHQKRIAKDRGCFEDLLGVNGREITVAEYEQRSQAAVTNSWGEYEGEGRDVQAGRYYPAAAYFVDDLVVAITDLERNEFLTCYHEHFSRPHGVVPGPNASVGQRRLRFLQQLNCDEQGKMIRNLRRLRNV